MWVNFEVCSFRSEISRIKGLFVLICDSWFNILSVHFLWLSSFFPQMEDDVEVELELEKQLTLAHELFWVNSGSGLTLHYLFYCPSNDNQVPLGCYKINIYSFVLSYKLQFSYWMTLFWKPNLQITFQPTSN
jgi:hypothetical protein